MVCDRFLDSSLAYQGAARGLGVERVRDINRFGIGGLTPDLTVLLDLEPEAAAARSGQWDRIEEEGAALQQAVADAYRELACSERERWLVVDATGDAAVILATVLAAVKAAR